MELLEGDALFVSAGVCLQEEKQFLAGFSKTVCEISVLFPTSCNWPGSPKYLSQMFRATCPLFGMLHFCFVWIAEAELGSWRAFDETASLRKELEVGHCCYLFCCHYPSGEKDGNKRGRVALKELGYKHHMQLDRPFPTPHGENIL